MGMFLISTRQTTMKVATVFRNTIVRPLYNIEQMMTLAQEDIDFISNDVAEMVNCEITS